MQWRLWPELLSNKDQLSGENVFGFREAIDAIWKNQHPDDCSKAKFVVTSGWPGGFGSEVHVYGAALALALDLGRVFVPNPFGPISAAVFSNRWQIENSYCRSRGQKTLECYYEPWSTCVVPGIRTEADMKYPKMLRIHDNEFKLENGSIPSSIAARVDQHKYVAIF